MIKIRYVQVDDFTFWQSLNGDSSEEEFQISVRGKRGYVLLENNKPVGLLRYTLLWDNIPFGMLLVVKQSHRNKGYGTRLIQLWECEMKSKGYKLLLISTQVDNRAQNLYRRLGYKDCGSLAFHSAGYEQPMEMFMTKGI